MKRRRPASFGRRCIRCWFRHRGKVVRLLHFHDYSPCLVGGEPRLLVKLLSHGRYARGIPLDSANWWGNEVLPYLRPGQWVELVIRSEGVAA